MAPAPRQIPADVAAFTGRETSLADLDRLLAPAEAVAICVFAGTAGVGKTALAVRRALNDVGVVYLRLGDYSEACDHFDRALIIQRERHDRAGECVALTNLGLVQERLGNYDEALDHLQVALTLGRTIGYRVGQADALRGIGVVSGRLGRHDEAVGHLRAALELGREIGEADVETGALNELGAALAEAGRLSEVAALRWSALRLATDAGDRYEQARAWEGLARADSPGVSGHGDQARALVAELGLPEAGQDASLA